MSQHLDDIRALELINTLQKTFESALLPLCETPRSTTFTWLRHGGEYGGGNRIGFDDAVFNSATLNVSQVFYPQAVKPLRCATALSCIVHPSHPMAPSLHLHVSYTARHNEKGYWRIMADLNPSNPVDADTALFVQTLQKFGGKYADEAMQEGDTYFYIPQLMRHRGVAHFYQEAFSLDSFDEEASYVEPLTRAVIAQYTALVTSHLSDAIEDNVRLAQRFYHTLYLFQVLLLDRGTIAGLVVHDENDLGILGSLPKTIDGYQFKLWVNVCQEAQQPLVQQISDILGTDDEQEVSDEKKLAIASVLRTFYRENPDAMKWLAAGSKAVPTVNNHTNK